MAAFAAGAKVDSLKRFNANEDRTVPPLLSHQRLSGQLCPIMLKGFLQVSSVFHASSSVFYACLFNRYLQNLSSLAMELHTHSPMSIDLHASYHTSTVAFEKVSRQRSKTVVG